MLCHEGILSCKHWELTGVFSKESDLSHPSLHFKTLPLVAGMAYGLLEDDVLDSARKEITRKSPWAPWKEL